MRRCAPLWHGRHQGELEDLSFQYLMPDEYADIKRQFEKQAGPTARRCWTTPCATSQSRLPKPHPRFHQRQTETPVQRVSQDAAHQRQHQRDLRPHRHPRDCGYHQRLLWPPLACCMRLETVAGPVQDYIATPNPTCTGRCIHIAERKCIPFEVQIRTQEMHRTAEYGIAAHWMYKEGRTTQSMARPQDELVAAEFSRPRIPPRTARNLSTTS